MNLTGFWFRLWKRRNEPPTERNIKNAVDTLTFLGGQMNLKTSLKTVQWLNLLTLLAQVVNDATNYFPALQSNKYFLIVQGIIGVVLPSISKTIHQAVADTPTEEKKG